MLVDNKTGKNEKTASIVRLFRPVSGIKKKKNCFKIIFETSVCEMCVIRKSKGSLL